MREQGAEALPAGAGERDGDGVLGQAGVAIALGDLAREHGAGGAVGVGDRLLDADRDAVLERAARLLDQPAVEDVVDRVVLALAVVDRDAVAGGRLVEQLARNRAPGPSSA